MLKSRVPLLSVALALLVLGGLALAGRGSGGTYTLPAGNPVVSGTTITSTWANNTLNDISTELTNSLDRQGRGGMLAALQLTGGTSAAPALTWSLEPSSGLYRSAAGDERFSVLGSDSFKFSSTTNQSFKPLTVTGRTTTTDLTVSGVCESLEVTPTVAGSEAINATGNGTGYGIITQGGASGGYGLAAFGGGASGVGVQATGGTTGHGASVSGGASGGSGLVATALGGNYTGIVSTGNGTGAGIQGTGGATSGRGIYGVGGVPNGNGIAGLGAGTGAGIYGTGGATGPGIYALAGTAATGATRSDTIVSSNGDISLDGVVIPNAGTSVKNRITPKNIIKAWASISMGTLGACTVDDGFNVSSCATSTTLGGAAHGADTVVLTFPQAFTSANFAVAIGQYTTCQPMVVARSTTTVSIQFQRLKVTGAGSSVTDIYMGNCVQNINSLYPYVWDSEKFSIIATGAQ